MIENEFRIYALQSSGDQHYVVSRGEGILFTRILQFENRELAQKVIDELNRAVQYGEGRLIHKFKTLMGLS